MLKTYYDYNIYREFQVKIPDNIFSDDFNKWHQYFNFLKSGTDLVLTNCSEDSADNLVTLLTTGRGESKLNYKPKFKGFNKNIVPKEYGTNETFFINEASETDQRNYRAKNPHYFGFNSDHFEAFEKLAMIKKNSKLPVSKDRLTNEFVSWDLLGEYLLPFSDCILIDNYIFSEQDSIIEQNLDKILIRLDKSTPVYFNLLLISYRGKHGEIKLSHVYEHLKKLKEKNSLKANISVIVSSTIVHDRNIFMNYMRINSGTGFNYFNTLGETIVDTELDFMTYTNPRNFRNSEIILKDVSKRIREILKRGDKSEVAGNCENRLLKFE